MLWIPRVKASADSSGSTSVRFAGSNIAFIRLSQLAVKLSSLNLSKQRWRGRIRAVTSGGKCLELVHRICSICKVPDCLYKALTFGCETELAKFVETAVVRSHSSGGEHLEQAHRICFNLQGPRLPL